MIRILVLEPNKKPALREIENTLQAWQKVVGGPIETVPLFSDNLVLVCNEEGKLRGLPVNRELTYGYVKLDVLMGTAFIAHFDGVDDLISLTEQQIAALSNEWADPGVPIDLQQIKQITEGGEKP